MILLRLLAGLLLALVLRAGAPDAADLYRKGRKAEREGKTVEAYLLYAQAAAADPFHPIYWQRSQALRTQAALIAKPMPPAAAGAGAPVEPDPEAPPLPAATAREREEAERPQPPVALAAAAGKRSFDLRGDAKSLWEQVARAYGLENVFDGDYQAGPQIRFRLDEAPFSETLRALEAVTASFIVPISPKLFMVVKDTQQKRTEVENAIAVTVPIPDPVTIQEAQEMARSVQQLMELQKFAIDSAQRLVFMRGPVSKVEPAVALFHELLHHRPQIWVEVEVLNVSQTSTLNYGIGLQTLYHLVPLGDFGPNKVPFIPSGIRGFLTFGGGLTLIGIGITDAQLLANATDSNRRSLLRTEVRTVDGQPATFQVGEKYPIVTATFLGGADDPSAQYTPPPMFQFEDLGLTLKVTPKVHGTEEVSLDVEAEYKTLGAAAYNGIPVISNRKIANRVRLRFGQWAVVAGLVGNQSKRSVDGLAGAARIPILSPFVAKTSRSKEKSETLVVIKPYLLNPPPTVMATRGIWTGTESRPRTPL